MSQGKIVHLPAATFFPLSESLALAALVGKRTFIHTVAKFRFPLILDIWPAAANDRLRHKAGFALSQNRFYSRLSARSA